MAKVNIDGVEYDLSDCCWYHVISNGKVVYSGNCGFDARHEARKQKGVSYYCDGELHYDGKKG